MRLLKTAWPYLALTVVTVVLFWTNYTPGTWLSGWDNLHPEFDFWTNIVDRSLVGTWQEYQGLGVRAGNAHTADLPRQLGLLLLSLFLEPSLLRYVYHFLALLMGGIGAYEFLRRIVIPNQKHTQPTALLGALFYILNPGTMQYFYVPYEAFSHFFASLPWLLLALYTFLEHPTRKTFLFFAASNLLAVPMSYIPTIFIVYMMICGVVVGIHAVTKHSVKLALLIFTTILCINSYWLLPFIDFVRQGTGFVSEVSINRIFTEEAFLRNHKFGTIADIALLKGFLFDTTDMANTETGQHDFMMKPWITHLGKPGVTMIGYGLFSLAIIGYILMILRFKPYRAALPILFLLSLFLLFTDNPPTGWLFRFLQNHLPVFKQVFRFPYTKILPLAALTYAIGLCLALSTGILHRATFALFVVVAVAIGYLNLPSFQGYFIYPAMRVSIPQEYFDLFQFFAQEPRGGKISNLPQPTFWGWVTYDWGYRGSGFPWYGIPQPIMDRAFDVWNVYNEQYYIDLTRALYTQKTPEALKTVFERYGITYVWLDERVILPHKPGLLFYPEIKELLTSTRFSKVFTSGKQTVYKFSGHRPKTALLPESEYKEMPFENILRNIHTENPKDRPTVTINENAVTLETSLSPGILKLPDVGQTPGPFPALIRYNNGILTLSPNYPTIRINGRELPKENKAPFSFSLPTDSYVEINGTLLSREKTNATLYPTINHMAVFSTTPGVEADITRELMAKPIHNCADETRTAKTVFGINLDEPDVISLVGQASRPCIYYRLVDLLPSHAKPINSSRALVAISFETRAKDNEQPEICLSQEPQTSCFYQAQGAQTTPNQWTQQRFVIPIGSMDLQSIWLTLQLNADGASSLSELSYKNVSAAFYVDPIEIQEFSLDDQSALTEQTISEPSVISIQFPLGENGFSLVRPANVPSEKRNCYALGAGAYERLIQEDPSLGNYVRYSARDASSCDFFPIPTSILSAGALVRATTRNIAGRPIKACLSLEPPGYCVFEDILSEVTSTWTSVAYFLPWIERPQPYQYYVVLDNYAVGNEERINDVASFAFYPLPTAWLSSITLLPKTSTDGNIWMLSQAYDPGWMAFEKISSFPYYRSLDNHVLVNNWANAWLLEEQPKSADQMKYEPSTNSSEKANTESRRRWDESRMIVVFFWPQILEWIGFGLLPILFIWSMIYLKHGFSHGSKHN